MHISVHETTGAEVKPAKDDCYVVSPVPGVQQVGFGSKLGEPLCAECNILLAEHPEFEKLRHVRGCFIRKTFNVHTQLSTAALAMEAAQLLSALRQECVHCVHR